MHSPAKIADAFAVNDADLKNSARLAGGQVVRHQVFYVPRTKSVQVKHAINWELNWFVHDG